MNHNRRRFIQLKKFLRANSRVTAAFKSAAKFGFTILALYIVFRNVDTINIWKTIKSIPFPFLLLALVFYNLSQVISAIRLLAFLQAKCIPISWVENLKLYYRAMFYNLLLPGGIGGDGYKILVLKKISTSSYKEIAFIVLLDRFSGGIALCFLSLLFVIPVVIDLLSPFYIILLLIIAISIYPISYFAFSQWLKEFKSLFGKVSAYAFMVQVIQLGCAFALFAGLGISENQGYYFAFFLLSSVFTFIPFTIGGLGARELVFILAAEYTLIDGNLAVAFAVLFSGLTLLSSLPGSLLLAQGVHISSIQPQNQP